MSEQTPAYPTQPAYPPVTPNAYGGDNSNPYPPPDPSAAPLYPPAAPAPYPPAPTDSAPPYPPAPSGAAPPPYPPADPGYASQPSYNPSYPANA